MDLGNLKNYKNLPFMLKKSHVRQMWFTNGQVIRLEIDVEKNIYIDKSRECEECDLKVNNVFKLYVPTICADTFAPEAKRFLKILYLMTYCRKQLNDLEDTPLNITYFIKSKMFKDMHNDDNLLSRFWSFFGENHSIQITCAQVPYEGCEFEHTYCTAERSVCIDSEEFYSQIKSACQFVNFKEDTKIFADFYMPSNDIETYRASGIQVFDRGLLQHKDDIKALNEIQSIKQVWGNGVYENNKLPREMTFESVPRVMAVETGLYPYPVMVDGRHVDSEPLLFNI